MKRSLGENNETLEESRLKRSIFRIISSESRDIPSLFNSSSNINEEPKSNILINLNNFNVDKINNILFSENHLMMFENMIKNNNQIDSLHILDSKLRQLRSSLLKKQKELKERKQNEIIHKINLLKNELKKLNNTDFMVKHDIFPIKNLESSVNHNFNDQNNDEVIFLPKKK